MSEKANLLRSFILGLIVGGALAVTGLHFYRHHWHMGREGRHEFDSQRLLEKFSGKLDLDADQKSRVEKILNADLPKMKALRDAAKLQFKAIRQSMQTEIRSALRPDQTERFDKMVQDYEKRREEEK